jgi:isoleucyl-tRNA synthetase
MRGGTADTGNSGRPCAVNIYLHKDSIMPNDTNPPANSTVPIATSATTPYPPVASSPSFPKLEEQIIAQWNAEHTFQASVAARDAGQNGANEYVFYDGPPFANGLPHYGHLLTSYVKDAIPRYQTMRGKHVERRFGWDTHGMPAEVQAEKELGVSGHVEINEFGIDKFNDACRTSVLRYTHDWEAYINRAARWVDFENDYKTLDLSYMESVMWAFKTLYDKGLIYEGYRVMPYCWRCETPLSNTELRMDDAYKQRQDPAVTVTFPLVNDNGTETGEVLLAWTTTPWTLPSNLACAVGPDIDYARMHDAKANITYLLAESRVGAYVIELAEMEHVGTLKGSELKGRRYKPLFDFFSTHSNAFQVATADYVTTEDGTGIVHIAPAFGEEDKLVTDALGIEVVNPVDQRGRFTSEVPPYVDQQVLAANPQIIKDLRAAGRLVRHDSYDHSYPHCWRCNEPLIYRALSSWFVEVTKFRDRMVELNKQITWVPEHVKEGSFGKWIANARDWGISRNRFWGSPIPVWKSDDPAYPRIDVYGSLDEMERDFGVRPTDLHRPVVDDLVRPNPDDPTGKSTMRRVVEVLDCWFESGSMPFAQVHYPFENKEWFEHHYPGDFIVEYIGQTRGWFYTLHVLATALFDRPSFETCVAHGIVLGSDGAKMSKSLKNYPDVYEVFNNYGSDAMRWFLLSSSILRGTDLIVTEQGIRDSVRQVLLPIWNTYSFFTLYANASNYQAKSCKTATDPLDQYILGKLHVLAKDVRDQMDAYDLYAACNTIRIFLDALTNWYVRRSRERFWDGDETALDVLWTVLTTVCQVAAPLLPLITDTVYQGLTGSNSVHLTDFPEYTSFTYDELLVAGMDGVRDVCSTTSAIRKGQGLRVRLPLASVTVAATDAEKLRPFTAIIADEVNVKTVLLTSDLASAGKFEMQVVPGILGPRIGKQVQQVIGAVKKGEWTKDANGTVSAAGVELREEEFTLRLVAADPDRSLALPGNTGVVVLDTITTPELEAEGMARDLIRQIQELRKESGLHVSDRIALEICARAIPAAAYTTWTHQIAHETLAERGIAVIVTSNDSNDSQNVTVVTLIAPNGERSTRNFDL